MLEQSFLVKPPTGAIVVDLDGGYLIKFIKLEKSSAFSILEQKKFPSAVVTVFKENGLKLSIETSKDFYAEMFYACYHFCLSGINFIGVLLEQDKKIINCYSIDNKIEKVFSRQIDQLSFENGFSTTEKFLDIAKHKLNCCWEFKDGKFIEVSRQIERKEDFDINNIPKHLIAYCFLEEFIFSNEVEDFLCQNLKENIKLLKNYLGDFIGIMPPPDFRDYEEIGLIYPDGENKYKVKYFKFEIKDKKIFNVYQ